jgi:hypothetical protein
MSLSARFLSLVPSLIAGVAPVPDPPADLVQGLNSFMEEKTFGGCLAANASEEEKDAFLEALVGHLSVAFEGSMGVYERDRVSFLLHKLCGILPGLLTSFVEVRHEVYFRNVKEWIENDSLVLGISLRQGFGGFHTANDCLQAAKLCVGVFDSLFYHSTHEEYLQCEMDIRDSLRQDLLLRRQRHFSSSRQECSFRITNGILYRARANGVKHVSPTF